MTKDNSFSTHLETAIKDVENNNKIRTFNFLDQSQIALAKTFLKWSKINFMFYGGYDSSERQKLILSPFEIKIEDFGLVCLKIDYNKRYLSLNHRNILGSLMSLGISRDFVGDIIVSPEPLIIVSESIASFLINNAKTISNKPISLSVYDNNKIEKEFDYDEINLILASLRLDNVISKICNISRALAQKKIMQEDIEINHILTVSYTKEVKVGDLISIRHFGRVKYVSYDGQTKKDKSKSLFWKLK